MHRLFPPPLRRADRLHRQPRPAPAPARRAGWLGLCLAGLLLTGPAQADGDRGEHDHDRARAAVQAGQALPLKAVLERLAREHPGEVLEVELERDDGRWIYEIKLLQAGGRLVRLELDAATGTVLRRAERGAGRGRGR